MSIYSQGFHASLKNELESSHFQALWGGVASTREGTRISGLFSCRDVGGVHFCISSKLSMAMQLTLANEMQLDVLCAPSGQKCQLRVSAQLPTLPALLQWPQQHRLRWQTACQLGFRVILSGRINTKFWKLLLPQHHFTYPTGRGGR